MIAVCIRYTIDIQIRRCGGELIGYFVPTKVAGATNLALALINFPNLAAYEKYRENLMNDVGAKENVTFADRTGCILIEDRSVLQQVS